MRMPAGNASRRKREKAILVGNSAGGMIAAQTALDAPERVLAMMLVSCATNLAPSVPGEVLRAYDARFETAFDYMIQSAISSRTKRERPEVAAFLAEAHRGKRNFRRERDTSTSLLPWSALPEVQAR